LSGHNIVMLAALALATESDVAVAAKRAIATMRTLHKNGLNKHGFIDPDIGRRLSGALDPELVQHNFRGKARVPARLLDEGVGDDAMQHAAEFAKKGPDALQMTTIPVARFGALLAMERTEIESLRHVYWLFREYLQRRESRPLSIAVFGSPG